MKLSKILLVSIILLAILSIGAVSAVDDDSSTLAASDSADIISADANSQNIYVDTAGNDSNTGSASSPFASLNRAISEVNASNDATIHVGAGVYSGENNTNLVINLAHLTRNGTLTIIGDSNGGTIFDGGDEAPIIYSIAEDSKVTLINIAFKNGKRDMGSAIRSSGNLTIDSCIFEANEATNLAAVFQEKANPLTIINSKFLKNKASQMADIYFSQNSMITLINNVFDGAVSSSSYASAPGVSVQTGKSIIKGNTFKNLTGSYYAILYVTHNNGDNIANITDNVFVNCTYTGSNGAILYVQNAYLKNNSFINCTTSTTPVYVNTNINSKVVFSDINVTGTSFNLKATVTDVDGNLAKGAKVYFYIDGSSVGSANSGNDGVATVSVKKLLENGQYTISGTQSYDNNPNPFEVTVLNGTATVNYDHSPAEFWVSATGNDTTGDGSESNPFLTLKHALDVGTAATVDLTVHVKDGVYNGSANRGLSYSNVGKITIIGESYGNAVIDGESASTSIFNFGNYLEVTLINLTIKNAPSYQAIKAYTLTMKDNIMIKSGTIYAQDSSAVVNIDNLTFINGTRQAISAYNIVLTNSLFENCNGQTSTGLLWIASNGDNVIRLENNTFRGNTIAGSSGGAAYYAQGNLISINNTFESNTVTGTASNIAYASGNSIISINDTFIDNEVPSYIAQYRSGSNPTELIVENITFINNTASTNGAGLVTTGAKIKGAKFINNTALGNGGAIYILNHASTSTVCEMSLEDVIFENNSAACGSDIFIAPGAGSNVFAHLGDLTITANSLNVTELSDILTVSVTHPSGAIIGGGQVKFYLDGDLVGKSDLINQNASFVFVGFEDKKVYNFTAVYEYANENDTYVSGTITTNISSQLDSIDLYVSDLTGDDNNNGSKDSPFKTISKALAEGYKKSTNVTVHVLEGTYSGDLNTGIDIPTTIYLTIVGEGTNKTIISDNTADYFLTILAGNKQFTLANMTLKRASRDTQSAIYVEEGATAEFNNVEFIECQGNYGGAINTAGILTITDSYFFDNGYFDISKRANAYYGGAIYNDGTLVIVNTTFEGNHAGRLSTIANQGELYMYNSNVIDSIDAYAMNMDLIAIGAFGGQKGNITIADSLFKTTNRTIDEVVGAHVYNPTNSLICLAIGSSQNILVINTTFVNEGTRFTPYVFGGINSWNLAGGGNTLVPGDMQVYNSTFKDVAAVNVFYTRSSGTSFHSHRLFSQCTFDNVEYVAAILNSGDGLSLTIHDSVIIGNSSVAGKIGHASGLTIDMDISDNWWGSNNATYDNATITTTNFISNYVLKLKENTQNIVNPESYLILTLNATDNVGLLQDVTLAFKTFDGENVSDYSGPLTPREFAISATNGTLAQTNGTIDGTVTIPFEGIENQGYYIEATVDNQTVNLTKGKVAIGNATILAEDILLQHAETQFNVTVLDGDKKVNTGKLVLKLFGETYTADVINGTATFTIPVLNQGNYSLEYSFEVDKVYNLTTNSSVLTVELIVTNETFFNFFDENGVLRDEIPSDNLTFAGEFSNLGIGAIFIDKTVNSTATDDVVLHDIALVIDADDVTVDNFAIVLSNSSDVEAAVVIKGNDVTIKNGEFAVDASADHNSYVILAENAEDLTIISNYIDYTGNTNGSTFNAAVNLYGCDNAVIENNEMDISLVSVPIKYNPTTWEGTVMSEGILIEASDDVSLIGNDIEIDYNDATGYYDTIYGVEFKECDNAVVSDNNIVTDGNSYVYGVVMNGDDFVVSDNNITSTGNTYANGIQITLPGSGVVDNNNISAEAPSVVYPVYSYGSEVEYTNNNIYGNANSVYGIELFESKSVVENNTIVADGNFTIGVASAAKELILNNNTIEANGLNIGTPTTGDSIKSETVGVKIVRGDVSVTDNEITSNSEFTINATAGSGNIVDNYLVAQNLTGDASVSYPLGDYAVYDNVPAMDKSFIVAKDTSLYYHNGTKLEAKLTDGQGNPLANKDVLFEINGVNYTRTTDKDGIARIAINLGAGEYPVTVYYLGNTTMGPADAKVTVTVLSTINGTNITKIFKNGTQYYATFVDGQGNYLANGTEVTFNINGVMYKRYINGNEGRARLNINLDPGVYTLTAINPVNGDMASNTVTVLAQITNNSDLVKYFRNDSQYRVKVLDKQGNVVGAGENVTFNINGVLYTRQTDAEGYAQLRINLDPGVYTITADYQGSMVSNSIEVLPVITASDLVKKQGGPEPFEATIVDGQGKPAAGQNVTFNINGVMYHRTADSEGVARLNINLNAGKYIITSMYNGESIGNNVTVTN